MNLFWQDLRYGCRTLVRNPGFACIAVLALALGIGANTAIFSVVNAVLLRPLLYRDPDRLVVLWQKDPRGERQKFNTTAFIQIRDRTQVFESVSALQFFPLILTGLEQPQQLIVPHVSANYFQTLGLDIMLARAFLPEEEHTGRDRVAVLAYDFWRQRFGGDPRVIGKTIDLNRKAYTVVGVLAHDARDYFRASQIWVPLVLDNAPDLSVNTIGRLKTGVSADRARAEVEATARWIEPEYAKDLRARGAVADRLIDHLVGAVRRQLFVLQAAVGFLLLIACANVANLLLARAVARQKEMSIRVMLGAGRARLVRQLVAESLPLAVLGAAAGLALAFWAASALPSLLGDSLPRASEIQVDRSVLAFTLAVGILTVAFFGLAPALSLFSAQDLSRGRQWTARGSARLRNLFLGSEIALALALLIGAGLLIRSFISLRSVDMGFPPERLLTMRLTVPESRFNSGLEIADYYERIIERVGALPGVESAAASSRIPLGGGVSIRTDFKVQGRAKPRAGEEMLVRLIIVSPGYFRTVGLAVVQGRAFQETDTANSPAVAAISQSMARRVFGSENPIGQRLLLPRFEGSLRGPAAGDVPHEIVAVVGDVKDTSLDERDSPALYVPIRQSSVPYTVLILRTKMEPLALAAAVRREIGSIDKDQPIDGVRSMDQWVSASLRTPRRNTILFVAFAGLALLLAASGIYGLAAYSVRQRTQEIGVRMALGAQQRHVLKLILWQGAKLVLASTAVGVAGSLALARLLSGLLYGVTSSDPITFLAASLLVVAVALGAMYMPAREAARIDPILALRHD